MFRLNSRLTTIEILSIKKNIPYFGLMKMLIVFILLIPVFSFAQDEPLHASFPLKDGKVYYEKIIQVDSTSKEVLFQRAKTWALSAFNSQKAALQSEDKDIGFLNYKTLLTVFFNVPPVLGMKPGLTEWKYNFNLKIYLKDNKAKIIFDDINLNDQDGNNVSHIETYREDTEAYFKRSMLGRGYREKYYKEAKKNFTEADKKFKSLIDSCAEALSTNSEAEF